MVRKYTYSIITALLLIPMFCGCKQKENGIPIVGLSTYNIETAFLEMASTTVNIGTKLTGGGKVSSDFEITAKVPSNAADMVKKYNAENSTAFELLPDGSYEIGTTIWTAGQKTANIPVSILRSKVGDGSYMLPVTIYAPSAKVVSGPCYITAGKHFYTNPVIKQSVSDPTILRAKDGYFYLAGTEEGYFAPPETQGMPLFKSKDLVNWEWKNRRVFEKRPWWENDPGNRGLWAPELRYINGKYYCFYSWVTGWGGDHFKTCEVGRAVSDKPEGPYRDLGELIDARTVQVLPSIDPFYFEDGGKKYLLWGSQQIWITELNDDGISLKTNPDGSLVMREKLVSYGEGATLYKRNGWYYFFYSEGNPLNGANSDYHIRMARSKNIAGPYVNKKGQRILDGKDKYELFASGDKHFIGTGHNSCIIKDDAGQTWMALHSYISTNLKLGHPVSLVQVFWDKDGWPYLKNGHVTKKALAPIIKK